MNRGLLFGLSAANVLLSAGLQFVPLVFFGAGLTVDTFVAALMVPSVITSIGAVVVTYSLVPRFTGLDPRAQGALTRRAFVAVSVYLGFPTVALIVLASVWVPWTVPGFLAQQVLGTVEVARVALAASLAGVYALVLAARLQANSEFGLNALSAVLAAGAATVFAVTAIGKFGIVAAAWSLVLKSILQFAIAWVLRPPRIRERYESDVVLGRRAGPLLASASISKLEPLVDRSLLTTAPPGFLTLFYLAQQIYGAMSQVVIGSLLAHVLTRFSDESRGATGMPGWSTVRRELMRAALIGAGFWLLLVASIFVAALLVDLLCPACSAFLGRPDLEKLAKLGAALGGVWFFGLQGSVLASFFYSHGDTMTPSLVAIVGFVAAIGLKVTGFRIAGPLGLAMASSVYFFSTSAAMFVLMRLRLARAP